MRKSWGSDLIVQVTSACFKKHISNSLGCIVLNVTTVCWIQENKTKKKKNFTDREHRTYQMRLKWLQNILAQIEAQRVLFSTQFSFSFYNFFQSKHRTNQHIKIYLLTQWEVGKFVKKPWNETIKQQNKTTQFCLQATIPQRQLSHESQSLQRYSRS